MLRITWQPTLHERPACVACRLRALDLLTGKDKFSSPSAPLAATQNFYGNLSAITFNAAQHWQRPGLTLYDNTIYAAFASHCDASEFHPWIFAIDATTLQARFFHFSGTCSCESWNKCGAGSAA